MKQIKRFLLFLCLSASALHSFAKEKSITVTVDAGAPGTPISPWIYGVNDRTPLANNAATALRLGGNRFTSYNWENNASNAGADYYFTSDSYVTSYLPAKYRRTPAGPALALSADAVAHHISYTVLQLQMAGYVAADMNGKVTNYAPSKRWVAVVPAKGKKFDSSPNLKDNTVFMDEYVQYLKTQLGDSTTTAGIKAYELDNEPSLWYGNHKYLHENATACDEIIERSTALAKAVKKVDSHAEIFGPSLYGFNAYVRFQDAPDWSAYEAKYDWFIDYYLDKMKDASYEAKERLLDVLDLHYYSEARGLDRITECTNSTHTSCIKARLQAVRTLWDFDYHENSWLSGSSFLPLLPSLEDSISNYYPGTKIGFTEYSFGGGNHVSGAIAEADALGTFGSHGVYFASYWPSSDNTYVIAGINLFRNYDGNGGTFGDLSLPAESSSLDFCSSYAARDSSSSKLTVVVSNKSLTDVQPTTITISNSTDTYTKANVYIVTDGGKAPQFLSAYDAKGNSVTVPLPALSVAIVIFEEQ